ncbi:MAG: ATP-binding protein [Saprospiraceae bacterium]
MISRILSDSIEQNLALGRVVVIYGARQVGKTTLIKKLAHDLNINTVWWNGDAPDLRLNLPKANSTVLLTMIGEAELLIIDEAQRIENIGLILKQIIDSRPSLKIIATGSSSFDLANKINEPLTGRKWEFMMFALSTEELIQHSSQYEEQSLLHHRLIYGLYPEVVTKPGNEERILSELANDYLYKDILTWERISKPDRLERLVQAIAFQIGNQVSYHELGQISGLDFHTVERYINILEKAFVIFRLSPFSRNLRNEIKKSRKIYFYDNGIRNAVINQFQTATLRNDIGQLWENFLVSERMKKQSYAQIKYNKYFWRTQSGQEIDYIEERNAEILAFEFKWNPDKQVKFPSRFINTYQPKNSVTINPSNYMNFISEK